MTNFLFLSMATLFAGPAVLHFAIRRKATIHFIDAFVICSVLGIVLFHVLPESLSHGGNFAILAACVGLFAPIVMGRFIRNGNCHIHHTLLSLASVGLLSHAVLDGMVLSGANQLLAFAVILHRLPEGMGIWRLMAGSVGKVWALFVLFLLAFSTTAGFYFGESIIVYSDEQTLAVFEGLMAGVLLHVIFHRRHLDEFDGSKMLPLKTRRVSASLGALCGAALVLALFVTAPIEHSHAKSAVTVSHNGL